VVPRSAHGARGAAFAVGCALGAVDLIESVRFGVEEKMSDQTERSSGGLPATLYLVPREALALVAAVADEERRVAAHGHAIELGAAKVELDNGAGQHPVQCSGGV
jgi:hypothetical protein